MKVDLENGVSYKFNGQSAILYATVDKLVNKRFDFVQIEINLQQTNEGIVSLQSTL